MKPRTSIRPHTIYPAAILGVMVASFVLLPQVFGGHVDTYGVYAILQTFAAFGPVALAIGMGMIIGEYDLSAAAVYGLGALIAVELGVHGVVLGALVALAAGLAAGAAQGAIMARLGMRSVEVTLGGLLIIAGLTQILAHEVTVSFPRLDVGISLDGQVLSVFSDHSLIIIGLFLVAAIVMRFTRMGAQIRGVGGDRRSSRIAGVPVGVIIASVMAFGGLVAGLGGALDGYSTASAAPNVGLTALVFGTISAILGGVTLRGGEGSPLGIAAGALSLATLQQTLVVINAPPYVTDLVTGGLLVLVTLATAPDISQLPGVNWLRRRRGLTGTVGTEEDRTHLGYSTLEEELDMAPSTSHIHPTHPDSP